jgi:hypothetical protein
MSEIRAADTDRERAAETLRLAAAEGRLTADELEQRLEQAFAARTYFELEAVVADLPTAQPARAPGSPAEPSRPGPELRAFLFTSVLLVAIWALTGMGYFWPVWPILGWGVFVVGPSRWLGSSPCRRSASLKH